MSKNVDLFSHYENLTSSAQAHNALANTQPSHAPNYWENPKSCFEAQGIINPHSEEARK